MSKQKILILAERHQGRPAPITLEILTKARQLGLVHVLVLGPGASAAVPTLSEYGANTIHINEDKDFEDYLALPTVQAMEVLTRQIEPSLLLFGCTYDGRDVAGRLSARLGSGVISNATDVSFGDDGWHAIVPYFGGARLATQRTASKPALVLLRPKSVDAVAAPVESSVEQLQIAIGQSDKSARITQTVVAASEKARLEDAAVVVAGGRGMGGAENFQLLEELAEVLGGAVGASRAVVDAGWVPYSMQVGQTGRTVKPSLYVACGISGAMQHTVGMKGSKYIIAINKDADAPIHKMADLGIVGDALKLVPELTRRIRERRGS